MSDDDEYFDEYEDDPCDHDEPDYDLLAGRAHCWRCGEAWTMTDAEIRYVCEAMFSEPKP